MRNFSVTTIGLGILLAMILCGGVRAEIESFTFSDTRGMSIGGALSPVVDDAAAGLINPAVLGFMAQPSGSAVDNNGLGDQTAGWTILDFGASATLTGELGDYLQALAGIDFSQFEPPALQTPENIRALIGLAGALGGVGPDDTIIVNAHAGSLAQFGHFSIGIRSFGQVGGWINDLDLVRLGLQAGAQELANDVRQAIADEGFDAGAYEPRYLTGDSFQRMRDSFGGSATNDDVVAYLDYKLDGAVKKGELDPGNVKQAVDTLAGIIEASGVGDDLLDNETSITGRGFLAVEIPVSYGYAFNDNFAMGVTARAIFGKVYGTQVWAFNDDNEEILEDSLDTSVDRVNVGLDLAMMYRVPKWNFSLVGRNLNRPKFDGYTQTFDINGAPKNVIVPDVVLDPQVSAGAAWFPTRRLMLTSELELLETQTLLDYYNVQRLSFGSELDLTWLMLRLGAYNNIAEEEIGWVLTGGLGFNLWAVSIDAGAAVSIDDTVVYDDIELPRTVRLNLGLSMVF